MANEIKLSTGKVNIDTILKSQLNQNIFVRFLTDEGREFFTKNATLEQLPQDTLLTSQELHGKFIMILSGELFFVYNNNSISKQFASLKKGIFFALRKDFDSLTVFAAETTVVISLDQENLNKLFKINPAVRSLLKKTLTDIYYKLEELSTYYK